MLSRQEFSQEILNFTLTVLATRLVSVRDTFWTVMPLEKAGDAYANRKKTRIAIFFFIFLDFVNSKKLKSGEGFLMLLKYALLSKFLMRKGRL
jgi:hypothetical protein